MSTNGLGSEPGRGTSHQPGVVCLGHRQQTVRVPSIFIVICSWQYINTTFLYRILNWPFCLTYWLYCAAFAASRAYVLISRVNTHLFPYDDIQIQEHKLKREYATCRGRLQCTQPFRPTPSRVSSLRSTTLSISLTRARILVECFARATETGEKPRPCFLHRPRWKRLVV